MFGYLGSGSVVKNVGLYAPDISCSSTYSSYYGSLVGYSSGSSNNEVTIENCFSINGSVSAYNYVGGMIGRSYYTNVSNCYVNDTVSGVNGYIVLLNMDSVIQKCFYFILYFRMYFMFFVLV